MRALAALAACAVASAVGAHGLELWVSDGTTAGTIRLTTDMKPTRLTRVGNVVFFLILAAFLQGRKKPAEAEEVVK